MHTTPSRAVHVGLLAHSLSSENLGIGAFTIANMTIIGNAIEARGATPVFHIIGVRGDKDYSDATPWPADFTNIGVKSLLYPNSPLHRIMPKCDMFFAIAGGDSLTDIYGPKRLFRLVGARVLAARTGHPIIMSPQTVGPFTTALGKALAKIALDRADRIFTRDALSFEALEPYGVMQKAELTTDLAFLLPYERKAKKGRQEYGAGNWDVGLNVSGLLFGMPANGNGRIRLKLDYAAFTRKTIERLLANPMVGRVHIVPHVLTPRLPNDDDGTASRILKGEYPELVIAPDFDSPSQAKSYIAGLDLLLGARMHATIAAISSDTAVLPLAYSRKFNGLYGSLNYPHMVDMVNGDEAAALATLEDVLARLADVAEDAARANALARTKLKNYVEFVDRFIEEQLGA
ncbi:polysaccharide pyruvyl transferase family protein [Erythrobacter sp.]|uniref:polysaccharide pyruvyl transferase family protein n=1 Tax=Erythrobacter sp. TaxID=1042 RepID=UPI003C77B3FD